MSNFKTELNQFFESIESIPERKKYWLIRTEGGEYFESFRNFNYIALGYDEILYSKIFDLKKTSKNEEDFRIKLKAHIDTILPERATGLIASQLTKFIYEVKKGDLVIVPSENSTYISIGQVNDSNLMEVSDLMIDRTDCPYRKRKSVKWIKTIDKKSTDLLLYRALQSHQAITDISKHANIIERSIGDFYKLDDETNLIINVQRETNVPAPDLLFFGSDLLKFTRDFIEFYDLDFDISDIEIKINVNSKGKTQFLSKNGRLILLLGVIFVGTCGGGLKVKWEGFDLDLSTDGIISKVIDYQNNYHDRKVVDEFLKARDTLEIANNEDLLRYLKQFSTNKDKPK
jgi:restriction system protein